MRLTWSALAMADRDAIFTHIEADNPRAAIAIDERIAAASQQLRTFPESGRIGRVPGTRELVIAGTTYIAAYVATSDMVRILRVLHGAQPWPDEFSSHRSDSRSLFSQSIGDCRETTDRLDTKRRSLFLLR